MKLYVATEVKEKPEDGHILLLHACFVFREIFYACKAQYKILNFNKRQNYSRLQYAHYAKPVNSQKYFLLAFFFWVVHSSP